jgi:hypothetical protein
MAQFCTRCGESLDPDDRFCAECGAPVRAVVVAPGTSERWRGGLEERSQPGHAAHSEQWLRVFGGDGLEEDRPPQPGHGSAVGAVALVVGVATPLLAVILDQVGQLILLLGGALGAVLGGAGVSLNDTAKERSRRDLAVAGLVFGALWLLAGVVAEIARAA